MSQERLTRHIIERVAENRIREAIENGEFEDLPGLGKPIPGIDEPYDPDWWVKQWYRRERRAALTPGPSPSPPTRTTGRGEQGPWEAPVLSSLP